MNSDPMKTAGWLRREGTTGTDEEIDRYARDWLTIRQEIGIALRPVRGEPPASVEMRRLADKILREKTRTRVMDGQQVWVQVRGAMRFFNQEMPGATIAVQPTVKPDTDWKIVGASDMPFLDCQWERFRIPVRHEWRDDIRNKLGSLGASVDVYPQGEEWEGWIRARVSDVLSRSPVR